MSDLLPPHDDLDLALEDLGAALGAAEVHGLLVGLTCAGAGLSAAELRGLLDAELDIALDEQTFRDLREVNTLVRRQLEDDDLGFELLLPDDDRPLAERVNAMAQWCDGFLAGFGAGSGGRSDRDLSADVRDLLGAIGEFTRAEMSEDEDEGESSEREYFELVEYLRVAALTIFLELARPRDGGPAPGTPVH